MMIMLIFTIALDMFAQVLLDDAVRNAVRQVQMGKITSGTAFVSAVCSEFGIAGNGCSTTLQYDVQGAAYFGAISPASLSASGTLSSSSNFAGITTTAAGAPVFIFAQVAYRVPFSFVGWANGVIAENGTPSLYAATSTGAEF